jgi:hypothetical protein
MWQCIHYTLWLRHACAHYDCITHYTQRHFITST